MKKTHHFSVITFKKRYDMNYGKYFNKLQTVENISNCFANCQHCLAKCLNQIPK